MTPQPETALPCPLCGGTNGLHLEAVVVANRHEAVRLTAAGEDEHATVRAAADPLRDEAGRRHLIRIEGWCEQCGDGVAINLRQHKGDTLTTCERIGYGPFWQLLVEAQQ